MVAKFVVENSTNAVNLDATLKLMNLDVSSTIANSAVVHNIKIYKTSIAAGNLLATQAYNASVAFSDTTLADADFTDVVIAAGGSVTIIVTADTQDGVSPKNFSAGLEADDITWSDAITAAITAVDTLPLTGKTLSY